MTTQELDRLAAEKVMGWEVYTAMDDARPITYIDQHLNLQVAACWSPTTNEAHAALVRERMRELGWILELLAHPKFHVAKWINEYDRRAVASSRLGTPSVAYAITQAALLAVGAVTEGEL